VWLWARHHLEAARREVQLGHNAAALGHLRAGRFLLADHPDALLLAARIARRGGAWSDAERALDRYWEKCGDDDALVLERLLLRATRGELEAVGPKLQALIERDDTAAELAREALVAGLLYRFHLHEAERLIGDWLKQEPDSTMALLSAGKLQERKLKSADALESYRRILELDAEHDEARLRLTTILVQLSQSEEALPHLEYLRKRLPGNAQVMVQLAQALDLQERSDEARAVLDECLGQHPDEAASLAERGRIALRDGEGLLAEEYLARAIRLEPGDASMRHRYRLALNYNGKKEEAARQEEEAQKVLKQIEDLDKLFNGRLQETPNDPDVLCKVAEISLSAGRAQEGLRWLQNALQVDPNHLRTHKDLVLYYEATDNPVLAARHRAIARKLAGQERTKAHR
jgi:predicted Zn-dependent protease